MTILEYFSYPTRNPAPVRCPHQNPSFSSTQLMYFHFCKDLSVLNISYKWSHTVCGLLCLASFIHASCFQGSSTLHRCFDPFDDQIILGWSTLCLSIHLLMLSRMMLLWKIVYKWKPFLSVRRGSLPVARGLDCDQGDQEDASASAIKLSSAAHLISRLPDGPSLGLSLPP